MTSWRSPPTIVSLSISSCVKMIATQTGWIRYGSPDFLFWSLCASLASSYAFRIIPISSCLFSAVNSFVSTSNNTSGSVKLGGMMSFDSSPVSNFSIKSLRLSCSISHPAFLFSICFWATLTLLYKKMSQNATVISCSKLLGAKKGTLWSVPLFSLLIWLAHFLLQSYFICN